MTTPEYYAVHNPLRRGEMTYWRRDKKGRLKPWPPKVHISSYLPPVDAADAPDNLDERERKEWVRQQHLSNVKVLMALVDCKVGIAAAARFAVFASRCCACGRELTDPASKTYGVGPECRSGMRDDYLEMLATRVSRAHAATLEVTQ